MGNRDALNELSNKVRLLAEEHFADDEDVHFCLVGQYKHALVALDDRLLIVKRGVVAGSTFGGKVTTFHYRDITNLEQRKSMMFGYIEVLTPSYQASAADADRYKAENALVLNSKKDLEQWKPQLQWLRQKINEAKTRPAMPPPAPAAAAVAPAAVEDDLTMKLERLATLRESGAISEEEFQAAKQQLLF